MKSRYRRRFRHGQRWWPALVSVLVISVLGIWIAHEMRAPRQRVPPNVPPPVQGRETECGLDVPDPECEPSGTPTLRFDEPWMATAPMFVRMAYTYAVQHRQDLQWIPCYCGCDRQGHRHVADCFVESDGTVGTPRLRMHAFHCNICLGIVLDVQSLREKGWSWAAIRSRIEQVYGRFGTGTPTPQPEWWTAGDRNEQ